MIPDDLHCYVTQIAADRCVVTSSLTYESKPLPRGLPWTMEFDADGDGTLWRQPDPAQEREELEVCGMH